MLSGNTDKIMELLMEGYDHILDVVDEGGVPITEVIATRGDSDMSNLLASIPAFEVNIARILYFVFHFIPFLHNPLNDNITARVVCATQLRLSGYVTLDSATPLRRSSYSTTP